MTSTDLCIDTTNHLKEWVTKSGISQAQLARLLGEHRQNLNSYIKGRKTVPVIKALKWAKIIGCKPSDLNPKLI